MLRIATVYHGSRGPGELEDMSYARWFMISEALARLGHRVDIVRGGEFRSPTLVAPGLREVSLDKVDWKDYDVIKTLFHTGYELLCKRGGADHPFVIAKLGSVVAAEDTEGIYFYGEMRERLYETQARIARDARYVTLLSDPARQLWRKCHGPESRTLLVPGAASSRIALPGRDPYPQRGRGVCVFAGNIYDTSSQPDANRTLVEKLNGLGERLRAFDVRLYMLGVGDASGLDPRAVEYLGAVSYEECWNYFHHADVGIVVSVGPFMHNNESTKIYHYLRAGLPVVSEGGFPNDHVVRDSGHGSVVPTGDLDALAEQVNRWIQSESSPARAVDYIMQQHTWDHRARIYDELLRDNGTSRE